MKDFRQLLKLLLALAVVLSAQAATLAPASGKRPPAALKQELGEALKQFKNEAGRHGSAARGAAGNSALIMKPGRKLLAAQRRLQKAITLFERSVGGMQNPTCKSCRIKQQQCMRRCRAAMARKRLKGLCRCIEAHATCLYCSRFAGDPSPLYKPVRWGSQIGCGI